MTKTLRNAKVTIRQALAMTPDAKLSELLAWAQDGNMRWADCCGCLASSLSSLVGVHSFGGCGVWSWTCVHGSRSDLVDRAYYELAFTDDLRMRRVIPIIKAQLRLRERRSQRVLLHPLRENQTNEVLSV